jgi:hypothetical protein
MKGKTKSTEENLAIELNLHALCSSCVAFWILVFWSLATISLTIPDSGIVKCVNERQNQI